MLKAERSAHERTRQVMLRERKINGVARHLWYDLRVCLFPPSQERLLFK